MGPQEKIFDLYYWEQVIQESGDGGKVVICRPQDRLSGRQSFDYVMKIRSKESLREQCHEEAFRKSQVRMLNFPPHVGVMPIRELLEDENFYYVIMDKAVGGTFFGALLREFEDGVMPPRAVKKLMREILEAVNHVHAQGMLHRDIKPDNLVVQFHDDPASPLGKAKHVMLIDFDHADPEFSPLSPSRPHQCYGTMRFNAPETLHGEYCAGSDLYSVGTILYLLMTGKMPFSDDIFAEHFEHTDMSPQTRVNWMDRLYRSMEEQKIDWRCDPWPQQPGCRDFCAALLAFDPRARPGSAEVALEHDWLAPD